MRRRGGFSLVEMVILLGVLAIVGTIGFVSLRSLDTRSRVRQAAQVVARQIDLARAEARRSNQPTSLSFVAGQSTFTYVDPAGATHVVDLPDAARLRSVGTATLTFAGPFGTVSPLAAVTGFVIESTRDTSVSASVRVVGVLGKVYVQ